MREVAGNELGTNTQRSYAILDKIGINMVDLRLELPKVDPKRIDPSGMAGFLLPARTIAGWVQSE